MSELAESLPWLVAMFGLLVASAFFSASEAALFSLEPAEAARLRKGTVRQQRAAGLLEHPETLLSAILFWNLLVNLSYFTLASLIALEFEASDPDTPAWQSYAFAGGSLFLLILFGEMFPKSLAVTIRQQLAPWVAAPVAGAIRLASPVMPLLRTVSQLSTRLLVPDGDAESPVSLDDLERLITGTTDDAQLIQRERTVLGNIVRLSDIRVDEWMRPRSQFMVFHPPVQIDDLRRRRPPSGYLLVAESETDEIAAALRLRSLVSLPENHIESLAKPVVYVPWCATVAESLERMRAADREVAAVLNEYGETIGVLTFDDVIDTLFNYAPSRSKRILDQNPIHRIDEHRWLVAGIVNVRLLAKRLRITIPATRNLTLAGVIQESLQRIARPGDRTVWGPLDLTVLEMPARGHLLIELRLAAEESTGDSEAKA